MIIDFLIVVCFILYRPIITNMAIHTLHGIVDEFVPKQQLCRNYVSRNSLEKYLIERNEPYFDWKSDRTEGDVITIDDSTRAGADACMLLRSLGFPVIFFINPWQIINSENYFFSLLDGYIDNRKKDIFFFEGSTFDLTDYSQVRKFRKKCKNTLMLLSASEAVREVSTSIANILGVTQMQLPDYTRPVNTDELIELRDNGVRIESHGWDHRNISTFSNQALMDDLTSTKTWLKNELGVESSLYAIPFGFPDLPQGLGNNSEYFLLEDALPQMKLTNCAWNRMDLSDHLQNTGN